MVKPNGLRQAYMFASEGAKDQGLESEMRVYGF